MSIDRDLARTHPSAQDYSPEACQTRRPNGSTDPLAVMGYNEAVPEENRFRSASPDGELGSTALCAACELRYSTLLGMKPGCHRLARMAVEQGTAQPATTVVPTQRTDSIN